MVVVNPNPDPQGEPSTIDGKPINNPKLVSLLRPVEEGHGPSFLRFTFLIQQGPAERGRFEFGCPDGSIYSVDQMWAIFETMRRIAMRRLSLRPDWTWCYVERNPAMASPRYSDNGYMMFP